MGKNFERAACTYAEGMRWASRFLNDSHQLVGILKDSIEAVKAKLPQSSRALKRVKELTEGSPSSRSKAVEPAKRLDGLITPRSTSDDPPRGDNPRAPSDAGEF